MMTSHQKILATIISLSFLGLLLIGIKSCVEHVENNELKAQEFAETCIKKNGVPVRVMLEYNTSAMRCVKYIPMSSES